ncbi:inositol 2-dehydrogenase [candidate division KSB3 bacterium]|uniref:Inositol 2-dehydrogenase n=1 Tax=candidate division KSB3 bacterium TaxID=2044937 RepID=A0A9D5JWI7_9BACT|nr:inositol 2-dehydrogenase [candidate division KSB3 bacterium]MBD3325584.1 inositol 2-dehydrogenase [candidate division KSB3 bacterium]
MAEQVRIGIIGAGRIGKLHARNLAFSVSEAEVAAVSDVYLEAAEQCAAECRIPKAVKDHRVIMDDPAIEAIFICSSTDTHSQMICEGAAAGKHIFCEKPIDFDLARIDESLKAVDDAGVKLQIGFNRRFDPSFKRARDMVAAGKIGTPHIIRITSRDPAPPPLDYVKVSGGMFLDMTIHDFDMCRYLMGEEVTEVYATGTTLIKPEFQQYNDIDTALLTLTYQNGAFCTIDNSRQAVYGYDQRVEVFGSQGCIVVGNRTPYDGTVYLQETVQQPLPLYFFLERYTEAYIDEARQFIACIQQDTPPPVVGIDGKIPVLMGLAAQQSLREHRPVKVELDK